MQCVKFDRIKYIVQLSVRSKQNCIFLKYTKKGQNLTKCKSQHRLPSFCRHLYSDSTDSYAIQSHPSCLQLPQIKFALRSCLCMAGHQNLSTSEIMTKFAKYVIWYQNILCYTIALSINTARL